MVGGRVAATAAQAMLVSGNPAKLRIAPKLFRKNHGPMVKALWSMQDADDNSDGRRERFVSLCPDVEVHKLAFEAYMNKKPVKARPLAHLKIGFNTLRQLLGLVPPEYV